MSDVTERGDARGRNFVLVVDNQPYSRVVAGSILENLGWPSLLAADLANAVELFREFADRIAAILLDRKTAEIAAERAVSSVPRLGAGVPLIVYGPGQAGDVRRLFPDRPQINCIPRPFSYAELDEALRQTVER
jgi:CheY-like chemotaxis protein